MIGTSVMEELRDYLCLTGSKKCQYFNGQKCTSNLLEPNSFVDDIILFCSVNNYRKSAIGPLYNLFIQKQPFADSFQNRCFGKFWKSLFLIKLQAWRCFSINIKKFLRTSFLSNTSAGCFWQYYKNSFFINSAESLKSSNVVKTEN